ncbi:MAG TPA: zinc ribbon domain-containing protein [Anaerolineales bacterium]
MADSSELLERAATSPLSLLALVLDVIGEMKQENLAPHIWDAVNDLCALTRSLAGEEKELRNPKSCHYCGMSNNPEMEECVACGAALLTDLPRVCPKCGRGHASDALFCQACGTRLLEG